VSSSSKKSIKLFFPQFVSGSKTYWERKKNYVTTFFSRGLFSFLVFTLYGFFYIYILYGKLYMRYVCIGSWGISFFTLTQMHTDGGISKKKWNFFLSPKQKKINSIFLCVFLVFFRYNFYAVLFFRFFRIYFPWKKSILDTFFFSRC